MHAAVEAKDACLFWKLILSCKLSKRCGIELSYHCCVDWMPVTSCQPLPCWAMQSHQTEAGTDVVNAKSGKGSATLSMAYAGTGPAAQLETGIGILPGARLGKSVLAGLPTSQSGLPFYVFFYPFPRMGKKRTECAYVKSDITVRLPCRIVLHAWQTFSPGPALLCLQGAVLLSVTCFVDP